jgi:hypothetical protein
VRLVASDSRDVLTIVEAAYHQHFKVAAARASVSFVGVEQIEILRYLGEGRYPGESRVEYVSLGMSRYPMSDPTATIVDEASAPRAELLFSSREPADELWRQLAVLAAAPAVEGAVYAVGNRVDLGEPLRPGSRCTGGILATSDLQSVAVPGVADVTVLQVLPATANELAWARVHGSDALTSRWQDFGVDLADLFRASVELS